MIFFSKKALRSGKSSSMMGDTTDGHKLTPKDIDFSKLPVYDTNVVATLFGLPKGRMFVTSEGFLRIVNDFVEP